jgi:hypothetical protein
VHADAAGKDGSDTVTVEVKDAPEEEEDEDEEEEEEDEEEEEETSELAAAGTCLRADAARLCRLCVVELAGALIEAD